MRLIRQLACLCLLGAPVGAWSADLLDLYNEAVASDPRLQRAESEAALFQAREKQAMGGLLPTAQAGAQGTRTVREAANQQGVEVRDYYNGERYYLSVNQPLYNKSAWETWRSATAAEKQYGARLVDTRGLIAVDLADRYTKVLAAEDNQAFVVAERQAAEQQLQLVRARYERQLAKITDLLAIEARVNVLSAQELEARNEVLLAREAMSEVLGRPVEEQLAGLRDNVEAAFEAGTLEEWVALGLAQNPGLEAIRHGVRAAVAEVKAAQGQHHPQLGLSLNAQRSDIGYENALQPITDTYVAALNLTIPLYSGGQVSGRVAEAQARLRMIETEYQQTERALRKNIRQSWLRTKSARERVAATAKALASAEKSYEAQQRGLEYGTVTVVDVLIALETKYEALRDFRSAHYDLLVQGLTLNHAAGQFAPARMADFNAWLASRS